MLTIRDIGTKEDCLKNIGMDFIESWYLKILIVEKILLKSGLIQNNKQLVKLYDLHESHEESQTLRISGIFKTGYFRKKQHRSLEILRTEFDQTLNNTFPMDSADQNRFLEIKSENKKYIIKSQR